MNKKIAHNKRAVEWPVVMIYVIFVAIMLIMGLFMVLKLANVNDVKIHKNLDELRFTMLADRLINSADCAAWEEQFTDENGQQKWQVRPGIISWNKLETNNINSCIKNKKYTLELRDIEGKWGTLSVSGNGATQDDITIKDTYFVQIYKNNKLHSGLLTIGFKI